MPWKIRLIRVAVGLLKRGNTLLVAERPAHKPYSGYWEFPGGKIEADESGESALKRELQEELGIQVLSASLWLEHEHTYPDKSVSLQLWVVDSFSGEPQGKENQRLRWATLDEIEGLKLLEGNRPILEKMRHL